MADIIDVYNSSLWVQLTQRGLTQFEAYATAADSHFDAELDVHGLHAKEAGWYTFNLETLYLIFGPIMNDGHGSPFVNNFVHSERPY